MEGDDHREAYTAIVWGGLLSRERHQFVEAETVDTVEGNMCGTAMRGADAPPWSKTPSRPKGMRRNLGDLIWSAAAHAAADRGGNLMGHAAAEQVRSRTRFIVVMKRPNKAAMALGDRVWAAAEGVERRRRGRRKSGLRRMPRAQYRTRHVTKASRERIGYGSYQ